MSAVTADSIALLALAIAAAAALYSSVGHGGASAYVALMALFGMAPQDARPVALALNIVVAGYAAIVFVRAGRFDARVFWPFAITAIPAAFFAGGIDVPASIYRPILAAALGAAALRYLLWPKLDAEASTKPPPLAVALPVGAALGALAGITGIGGGVYLSPLLVFARWSDPARAAGIAACFIVVNSAAGLAGGWTSLNSTPAHLPWFALAALAGALGGASLSLAKLDQAAILRTLGVVLAIAALALLR